MASSAPSTEPKKPKQRQNHSLKELKTLGIRLLSSRAHINNLPLLLTYVNTASPPQYALESILSLQSFFTPLLPQLPSSSKVSVIGDSKEDPEIIYRTWVRSKFDEFVKSLIDVVLSPQCEGTLREIVVDTIMEFVRVGNGGRFNSAIYHRLLHSAVHSTDAVDFLLELLASKYFEYIDVRYFTHISLEKLAKTLEAKESSDKKTTADDDNKQNNSKESMELSIKKIHYLISHIPPVENGVQGVDYEMWSKSDSKENNPAKPPELPKREDRKTKDEQQNNNGLTAGKIAKKMKLKFSKSWISFLRLPLPLDVYKEVLANLHQAVMPYMSNPPILCDFLTRSYDIGGVVSVMALSSLFILMTQHGLEYPNFYDKLYGLLEPSIFMAKHRAKFFQLLDSCLKSPLVPAHMAASFAKKLSRLAVSVPPSGALIIIALIHNLLRRHPSINCLVHREDIDETENDGSNIEKKNAVSEHYSANDTDASYKHSGIDHFNSQENNPMKTKAMRSSLWEIDTLRHHYCPPVSRFVSSLEEDLTVRAKTTEVNINDFSSASYATIFGDEIRRRVKQVPLAFYKTTPTSLFSDSDFVGWSFKYKENEDSDEGENKNKALSEDTSPAKRQRVEC